MTYILVAVDYVSKWVEAVALPNKEARSVTAFLKKNTFTRFGTPRSILSDCGSHFCNKAFAGLLEKYGVKHKAFKRLTLDWAEAANLRMTQLNEMEEFCFHAYENAAMCKERMKFIHDNKILKREFESGDMVLLFNSRKKFFLGKLKSKWSGPFKAISVSSYGAIVLESEDGTRTYKVNGQRVTQNAKKWDVEADGK
ncbi:uncharacterized protein [Nicotiana tomentosiformis]|uniref:uncharacterized protein n=1 Tax=Nicotiana tomentosiformis TaxID=4098 RepID=UPI00388C6603